MIVDIKPSHPGMTPAGYVYARRGLWLLSAPLLAVLGPS